MSRIGYGVLVVLALISPCLRASDESEPDILIPPVSPPPGLFYTGTGQFEVIVAKADDARLVIAVGQSVWRELSVALGLPAAGFSTPVSVRLIPAAQWTGPDPFTVSVETPGVVSVWVRWDATDGVKVIRHALVHGLVLRQAVAWHGVAGRLTVPLWLVHGCVELSRMRARPSLQDMFQQESADVVLPPSLASLLQWRLDGEESRERDLASLWLLLQLQSESGDSKRCQQWLRGVVGGADALDTLPRIYSGLWTDMPSMELWWQTAFYHQSRSSSLPLMTGVDSRAWLADRSRWLASRNGREVVLSLGELAEANREAWVHAELTQRVKQLHAVLPIIHPTYANAALSLGRLYDAALKGKKDAVTTAFDQFMRDARDARELDDTIGAILDTAPRK